MTAFRTKCTVCGKPTRHKDGICEHCRQINPIVNTDIDQEETIIEDENLEPENEKINTEKVVEKNEGDKPMKIIDVILKALAGILLVVLIIVAISFLAGRNIGLTNSTTAGTTTGTTIGTTTGTTTGNTTSTTAATTAATTVSTTAQTTVAATTAATTVSITPGLDYPSKSWLMVKAGSVMSADLAIFQGDNNSKKIPIYDNSERTADFVYFGKDVNVWLEWGGTLWTPEEATSATVAKFINIKLVEYPTVRFIVYNGTTEINKLTSKTDAATIEKIIK